MTRSGADRRRDSRLAVAVLALALGCSSTGTPGPTGTGGAAGQSAGSRGGDAGRAATGGGTGGGTGGAGGGAAGRSGSGGFASGGAGGSAGGGAAGRAGTGGGQAGAGGGGGRAGAGGSAGRAAGGQSGHAQTDGGTTDGPSLAGTNNPVLPGLTADPQVALFDGVFYIYPTTDGFANWSGTTFSVFSSTNLVTWTSHGVVLDLVRDVSWGTAGYAWAPAIARSGGSYYFYFCANKQIGVAVASSPTGPFKDALGHPLIAAGASGTSGTQVIDPYVFTDDDGTNYLYFGSASGGLRLVKLGADMKSLVGTPANISPSGASGTLEGSVMFKRNGTYYLQWSEGDTRLATYQVAYARAKAPAGPFTREGVILSQNTALGILGPGGNTVLSIPGRDETYIVYHRFKIPGGDGTHREVCIDRMTFNADGTIAPVHPTLTGLQSAVNP